ncbi:MAG: hypothetical protein FJ290_24495 [Planctomycetes bacterium]|nr:hypothetical protein [Planctomycetota bacterium]
MTTESPTVAVQNPYPGLRTYETHEWEHFFGRNRQIDELLVRLRDHRFVAVVGLSGSGKSSLVRAGLIHRLEVGHLTGAGARWRVALFRPGAQPLEALAPALDETLGPIPERAEALSRSTQALVHATRAGRRPEENLLLVVDQFEEIFRFQQEKELSPRDAAHFVELLLAAEQDLSPDYRVYVVLTMRSDYLGDCAQFEGLPEALNRCQYLVPRMTGEQMAEAIEGPAALTDTEIEPDLLQRLVVEAAEGRDALPLLQHLLMCLWEEREPSPDGEWRITSGHYDRLGGPVKALNDHADQVLGDLQPEERQDLAARVFQQLTDIREGRDQRRPARLSRLAELTGGDPGDVEAVVEHLFGANFLTSPDRGRTPDWEVDITHESLIRQWEQLREWAKAEAADAEEYREFAKRAARGGELLAGTDLDLALKWLAKKRNPAWAERHGGGFTGTVAFIERSQAAWHEAKRLAAEREAEEAARKERERAAEEERKEQARAAEVARKDQARRLAYVLAGVSLLVAVIVGALGVYAWRQRGEAERQRGQAERKATEAKTEREKADELRARAERLKGEADTQRSEAVKQRDIAHAQRRAIERQRTIITWQTLAREAIRDAGDRRNDERAALLARQALLFHAPTPGEPKNLVEEAVYRTAGLWPFSHTFEGHQTTVLSVAFSPDGTRLASGSEDRNIRLWDLQQPNAPPLVLQGHQGYVQSVAFSPDGTRLASGSYDRTIRLWDLRQPNAASIVLQRHEDYGLAAAFSSDGTRFASGGLGTISLWDLQQPEATRLVLQGQQGVVSSLTFSAGGTRLASGSFDGTIRLWDLQQPNAPPLVLQGHQDYVCSVAFSTDGTRLASGSGDRTIRLWNLRQPNVAPLVLQGHQGAVWSVAFSADGTRLASGSADSTIRLWDLQQPNAAPLVLQGHQGLVSSVAFSRDGTRLASGSADSTIRLWDLRQPDDAPLLLRGHLGEVNCVTFSADGTRLASGSDDSTIRLWDRKQPNAAPLVLQGHRSAVWSVAFSADGTRLASGSADSTIRLWDLRQPNAPSLVLQGHQGHVNSVAFSADGTRLASGSADSTIRLWDLRQPKAAPLVLQGHQGGASSVAFSADGTRLASGGEDDRIRLWDLRQPKAAPLVLQGHQGGASSVAFSADGTRLASGSIDRTIRLWDLRQPKAAPLVLQGHQGWVRSLAFSADGTRLASGGWDRTIRLWDLQQPNAAPLVLQGHEDYVNSVAFSADGTRLASGSDDGTIRLWDLWTRAADRICTLVWRNLSMAEWRLYVGEGIPYQRTCPNLPPGAGTPGSSTP